MSLGVPEQSVVGRELFGKLRLQAVKLASELTILIQGSAQVTSGFLHLASHVLEIDSRLLPGALDLGLGRGDELFRVSLRFQRRLELRELSYQFLEQVLICVGLINCSQACGTNCPEPLYGLPGDKLRGSELLGGLLCLAFDLSRSRFRFGLAN